MCDDEMTTDDWFGRYSRCEETIIESGLFSDEQATKAVVNSDPATKEAVAEWLRTELKKLREGENTPGGAPVRRRKALSRPVIADIAMTMLGVCEAPPEKNLLRLLEELLGLDTHRAAMDSTPSKEFKRAASIEGHLAAEGINIGVRELARNVSVEPSTIIVWRRKPEYAEMVQQEKSVALTPWYKEILKRLRTKK
jgi:hypothetical protein